MQNRVLTEVQVNTAGKSTRKEPLSLENQQGKSTHSHVNESEQNRFEVPRGHFAALISCVDGVGQHLRVPEHPLFMVLAFPTTSRFRLGMPVHDST